MAYFLPSKVDLFPHPLSSDHDGLLAVGGRITPDQILLAYQFGIFPWYSDEDPLMWWFTHPRCVLYPEQIKISKSMRSLLNRKPFRISLDTDFRSVISECQIIRREGQSHTWITSDLKDAMCELHERGHAHSVEVWQGDRLVGGLYGLALGKIFYGESMFARVSNASKYGFILLARYLEKQGFNLIDCQQQTDHLMRMGATMMSGDLFYQHLKTNIFNIVPPKKWQTPSEWND